jgi:hypothetical protein
MPIPLLIPIGLAAAGAVGAWWHHKKTTTPPAVNSPGTIPTEDSGLVTGQAAINPEVPPVSGTITSSAGTTDTDSGVLDPTLTTASVQDSSQGLDTNEKNIYHSALIALKDPAKLETLAAAYHKKGHVKAATLLRKRAALRKLPKATAVKRKAALKKALASKKPAVVRKLAAHFEGEGATGAAVKLYRYADSLEAK